MLPPKINPSVVVPEPPRLPLPVFISVVSVHEDPFHDSTSVLPSDGLPPAPKAAVEVPNPASSFLPVFKSPTSVQPDPFHSSVKAEAPGSQPPKITPAVAVPAEPPSALPSPEFAGEDNAVHDVPLYCSVVTTA